jgi:hypothetical protein
MRRRSTLGARQIQQQVERPVEGREMDRRRCGGGAAP